MNSHELYSVLKRSLPCIDLPSTLEHISMKEDVRLTEPDGLAFDP